MVRNIDRITEAYHGKLGPRLAQTTRDRVHWIIKNIKGGTVLDVGCGQGIIPILLGREGTRATGIDSSNELIAFANEQLADESDNTKEVIQFIQGDFLHADFPNQHYETIILSEVLHQFTTSGALLRKAANLLKEEGQIIVTVPFGVSEQSIQKRTFYFMEMYQELVPYFAINQVEFMGKWVGFIGTKGGNEKGNVPNNFILEAEKAFYANERELAIKQLEKETELAETIAKLSRKIEESNTVIKGLQSDNFQYEETLTNTIKSFNVEKSNLVEKNRRLMEYNKNLVNQVEKKDQQLSEAKSTINRKLLKKKEFS